MSITAPTLTEVVKERVAERTGRRVRNLTVEIRAASYHVKQLAQQAVCEALPEARLENAIVVE